MLVVGPVAAFRRDRVDTTLSISDATLLLPAPVAMIAFALARPGLVGSVWFGISFGMLAGLGAAAITSAPTG